MFRLTEKQFTKLKRTAGELEISGETKFLVKRIIKLEKGLEQLENLVYSSIKKIIDLQKLLKK